MNFHQLEELGRIRLSQNFFMRDFLHSELSTAFNILNIPDDLELAVFAGSKLCEEILEPLTEKYGRIHIRSGYRRAKINEFGFRRRLKCSSNEKNYAYHIWDHKDQNGFMGAAACIVIPGLINNPNIEETQTKLAEWIVANTDFHRLTFFTKNMAFNIGWHQKPLKDVLVYNPRKRWLMKKGKWLGSSSDDLSSRPQLSLL